MSVKIAATPDYEDEKRQFHSNRKLLFLLLKKLTALSDIFFNFWKLCTWLLNVDQGLLHRCMFAVKAGRQCLLS